VRASIIIYLGGLQGIALSFSDFISTFVHIPSEILALIPDMRAIEAWGFELLMVIMQTILIIHRIAFPSHPPSSAAKYLRRGQKAIFANINARNETCVCARFFCSSCVYRLCVLYIYFPPPALLSLHRYKILRSIQHCFTMPRRSPPLPIGHINKFQFLINIFPWPTAIRIIFFYPPRWRCKNISASLFIIRINMTWA